MSCIFCARIKVKAGYHRLIFSFFWKTCLAGFRNETPWAVWVQEKLWVVSTRAVTLQDGREAANLVYNCRSWGREVSNNLSQSHSSQMTEGRLLMPEFPFHCPVAAFLPMPKTNLWILLFASNDMNAILCPLKLTLKSRQKQEAMLNFQVSLVFP